MTTRQRTTADRLEDVLHEVDDWAAALRAEMIERGENLFNGSPADTDSRYAYERMGSAGIIGLGWPEEFGGRSMDAVDVVRVEERMGYHWLPMCGYLLSVKTIGQAIMKFASPQIRELFLPKLADGSWMFCQGFSEPAAGSDLAGIKTSAVRDGDEWVVKGHKIWTSSAEYADWMFLAVRTAPDKPRHRGLSVMLLDMRAPGVTVDVHHTLGGSTFGEVLLDDVRVPASHVLGDVDGGWSVLMGSLDFERVTSEKVGVAFWVLDQLDAHADASQRPALLALRGELEACRRLGHEATRLIAAGERVTRTSSMCKLSVAVAMEKAAALALEILGPDGLVDRGEHSIGDGRLAAFQRSAVSMLIAGGASDVQRKVIAQQGLGMPR